MARNAFSLIVVTTPFCGAVYLVADGVAAVWKIQQHIYILKKYLLVRPKCLNSARIIDEFWFGVVLVDFSASMS